MGKTPIVARRDVPGFVWNRLQFALLRECLHLIDEGVADAATIDAAICEGLAPRWLATGPLATADLGGIRTFATIAEQLFPVLSAAREVTPALTARERFYEWTPASEAAVAALRAERWMLPARCSPSGVPERRLRTSRMRGLGEPENRAVARLSKCRRRDSNPRHADYDSAALTD